MTRPTRALALLLGALLLVQGASGDAGCADQPGHAVRHTAVTASHATDHGPCSVPSEPARRPCSPAPGSACGTMAACLDGALLASRLPSPAAPASPAVPVTRDPAAATPYSPAPDQPPPRA